MATPFCFPTYLTRRADECLDRVRSRRRHGDVAVVSIHWGDNWGYEVPAAPITGSCSTEIALLP